MNYREIDAVVASLTESDSQFPIMHVEINNHSQEPLGGLPDDRLGEVMGAVVATASARPKDIQKLRDFLVQHVVAFKVPERIWSYDNPATKRQG